MAYSQWGTADNGQWTMDNGQWTMDNGQWTMDNGQWTMDNGQCTSNGRQQMVDSGQGKEDSKKQRADWRVIDGRYMVDYLPHLWLSLDVHPELVLAQFVKCLEFFLLSENMCQYVPKLSCANALCSRLQCTNSQTSQTGFQI
jgi:hypothetical protein